MIPHYDVPQGSLEWLELRYGKIGGTLSAGLLVESDTLLIEMLSMALEPFELEDAYESPEMVRGTELEPEARKSLIQKTGIEFNECGWLQSETIPILGISPDGITEDLTKCCEIKCPGRKKHTGTILKGVIPDDNIMQCLHYFTVNSKLKELYFCSFRPEAKYPLFVKMITREYSINVGSKAKPILKSINDLTVIVRQKAKDLQEEINNQLNNIKIVNNESVEF